MVDVGRQTERGPAKEGRDVQLPFRRLAGIADLVAALPRLEVAGGGGAARGTDGMKAGKVSDEDAVWGLYESDSPPSLLGPEGELEEDAIPKLTRTLRLTFCGSRT